MKKVHLWKRIMFAVLAFGMALVFSIFLGNGNYTRQAHAGQASAKALAGAIPVEMEKSAEGSIAKGGDNSCYFKFTVPQGIGTQHVTVRLENGTGSVLGANMLDEKGNVLSIGIHFGINETCIIKSLVKGNELLEFHAILGSGETYYVKVFGEQGDASGAVTLSITNFLQLEEAEEISKDSLAEAIPVELGGKAEMYFKKRCYESHYFKFTVPDDIGNQQIVFTVDKFGGIEGEIYAEMLDAKGQCVFTGKEVLGGSAYSFTTGTVGKKDVFLLKPGETYYIKVENEKLAWSDEKVEVKVSVTEMEASGEGLDETVDEVQDETVEEAQDETFDEEEKTVVDEVKKPGKVKILSAENTKKESITVCISKAADAKKYEICYAADKKFKSAERVVTQKRTYRIKKLKKGTTYYIKARAVNGKKAGEWSKTCKVLLK